MQTNKKIIVIIPARGGSKRFPGKNIHPLCGKPLISYPILAAKNSELVGRVIVSTDDIEIAETAKKYGAEIPFIRPGELAGDDSKVVDTIVYTIKRLEEDEGYHADYTILLQPTTPMITTEQIDSAIKLAIEKRADSVVSVAPVDTINHPYNIREIKEDDTIGFWQDEIHYKFVQKQKPKFYHLANLLMSSYNTLVNENKLEGKKNYPLIVEPKYSLDIDYKEDLELIEVLLEKEDNNDEAKKFNNWNKKKIKHHTSEERKEIYFREKEIWWVACGKNIGYEIDGKQEMFERPVVIVKKYNENMCFIIPFTTKIKEPLPWFQVLADFGVELSAAVISQGRTISPKRLLRKEAVLNDEIFDKIIEAFKKQFK